MRVARLGALPPDLAAMARAAGGEVVRLRAPPSAAAFREACGFLPVQDARATHAMRLGASRPPAFG